MIIVIDGIQENVNVLIIQKIETVEYIIIKDKGNELSRGFEMNITFNS